jgi:hypothetical protein
MIRDKLIMELLAKRKNLMKKRTEVEQILFNEFENPRFYGDGTLLANNIAKLCMDLIEKNREEILEIINN